MKHENKKPKPEWVLKKELLNSTKLESVIVVGSQGVDGVKDGKLPNGDPYLWKKRRP